MTMRLMSCLRAGRALCGLVLFGALTLAACSPEKLAGNGDLPDNLIDPSVTHTPAGALNAYRGALVQLGRAFAGYRQPNGSINASVIVTAGLLSDELQSADIGAPFGTMSDRILLDSRTLVEYTALSAESNTAVGTYRATYSALQVVRGQANEAKGLVATYLPGSSAALVGHLETIQGYAETMLADLFCSGIPLSTVDYDADYTFEPGSSTEQVYEHALARFDAALIAVADSTRILNLTRIGRGRVLLALGRHAEAAQAVAEVPDGFRYHVTFSNQNQTTPGDVGSVANFAYFVNPQSFKWIATVAEREGGNGLDYVSSSDPRTAASANGTNTYGRALYLPTKYPSTGGTPVVLGDWIEARLIEAEGALQAGDLTTGLEKLNHLRRTAIIPALPDLTDPGTPDGRVDLLFRERAYWLFLTGHRQGDMRRLIRHYGRDPELVYPSGSYPGGTGSYGGDVTAPIPASERAYNPKFTGCLSRGA